MLFLHCRLSAVFAVLLALLAPATRAQVIFNELSAKSSEQTLQYMADGTPVLGYLPKWNNTTFTDTSWASGQLPAGYGSTVTTNLQATMQNKAPSLYLRKTFTATSGQAASTQPLVLQVDYDDGFVAYINGVEVARYNCGGVKHFMYAAQTAYNTSSTGGVTEVTLGAANTLLVTGTNTLSIEARNYDFGSNFRINAGLKVLTSTTPVALVKALFDNNSANGASKTHTNTNGATSNTSSGTPVVGGWLAGAPNPTSDNLWTSLQIVTAEQAGVGVGGSGAMRYTITQTGTNRTASVSAPPVTMTNAWVPGGLATASLSSTTVKFRYRTTGDLQFGLRFDPGAGQGANSTGGFPTVGLPIGGVPDYAWDTNTGAFFDAKFSATGVKTTNFGGSIDIAAYEINGTANVLSGETKISEDFTAGAGPGGSTGIFTYTYVTFPAQLDSLSFGVKNLKVPEWPATTGLSVADFQRTRLSFRWKMPVGRKHTFYIENGVGGSSLQRGELGTFTGTGNWEFYSVSLSDLPQGEALRLRLAQSAAKSAKLTSYFGAPVGDGTYTGTPWNNGESLQLDSLNLYYEAVSAQLDENIPKSFGNSAGAMRARTIDGAGTVSDATTGTPVNNLTLNSDPGLTSFAFRVVEDNTAAAGNAGSTGFLRCEVTQAPATGAPWGFSLPGVTIRNWTSGAITAAQLSDVSMQLAVKIPAGVTITLFAEPVGGSTVNRANLGTLTGNGAWQTLSREFNGAANVTNFRTALNTAGTTAFQLTFVGPNTPTVGDQFSIDDVVVVPWRSYSVLMSAGINQQRFLDSLNASSSVTFVPTFVKNNAPPAGGATFTIDDFEVDYDGQDPNAFQSLVGLGGLGGNWKYFVGVAEPSGGLYDPALITSVVPPPAGEEDDYDNPKSFRDWVELKNLGATAVTLTNWTMTDDNKYPAKWKFPTGKQIPAGGYLIVMCDNRDEVNGTATYVHSNFNLSAGDPKVYLYNASGVLQDQLTTAPGQDSFHTWGRLPDGTGSFGFLDTGTPGAVNAGVSSSAQVKIPDYFKSDGITPFSGGFYTGAQTLVMKCATAGAQIRYTTDGTDPTETTGTLYAGPITLTPPADHKSALIYKARGFKAGLLKSDPKTHSYLLDLDARLKGVPAMIFTGNAGQTFYAPNGILAIVGGTTGGDWIQNGPFSYNIVINHGDDVERQCLAEYYYPDGKDGWREEIGIRPASSPYSRPHIHLLHTADSPWQRNDSEKISFNLYWRGDYGNDTVKDDNFIPGNDVTEYSRLRIRAGKNDISNPFILDEMSRRLFRDMGWVQPTGSINTLYVNGSFKGMFNACERLRGKTFAIHYRTTNDFDVRYIGEMVDGDATFWNSMQTALSKTMVGAAGLTNYQDIQNYLDVTNVADYFLHNIYINNNDWPNNNWAAQRERTPAGRYRMTEWDCEGAFGLFGQGITYNTIDDKLLNQSTECGDIFKKLYASPEFKLLVADRIQKHMFNGGVLDDRGANDHFQQVVSSLAAQVTPLISYIENGAQLDLHLYNAHIDPNNGRRAYLFGTAAGNFRAKGLWPGTLAPTFSQFGGIVPAGYQLTLSMNAPAGAAIYYTLDGSDPRLAGGGISQNAILYSGPVTLNFLTTVNARVLNKRTISSITTGAIPVVTTTTAHGFSNGDSVTLTGTNSTPNIDGGRVISAVTANTFTVAASPSVTAAGTQGFVSEWSALNSAYFEPAAAQPTPSTLVVSELMFHPPDPTTVERLSGFEDSDDFEFVRLTNVGATPLDLRNLRFTQGITYDFTNSVVDAINPGTSVLVVKNKDAFQYRYGQSYNATIAGEYAGSFGNGGEIVTLVNVNGATTTVQTFTFNGTTPWYKAADGYGPSLMLINPASAPAHNNPANWITSAQPGGMPGGVVRPMTYAGWKQYGFNEYDTANTGISGPLVDPEFDGLNNFLEYILCGTPGCVDSASHLPVVGVENFSGQNYATLTYTLNVGATDATVVPEVSGDLATWASGAGNVVVVSGPTANANGSVTWKVRDATPTTSAVQRYIHLKATGP
jgi:hypothetical protein